MKGLVCQRRSYGFVWVCLAALLVGGPAGDRILEGAPIAVASALSVVALSDSYAKVALADPDVSLVLPYSGVATALADQPTFAVPDATPWGALETSDECILAEDCIDQYLWSIYERTRKVDTVKVSEQIRVTVKKKGQDANGHENDFQVCY